MWKFFGATIDWKYRQILVHKIKVALFDSAKENCQLLCCIKLKHVIVLIPRVDNETSSQRTDTFLSPKSLLILMTLERYIFLDLFKLTRFWVVSSRILCCQTLNLLLFITLNAKNLSSRSSQFKLDHELKDLALLCQSCKFWCLPFLVGILISLYWWHNRSWGNVMILFMYAQNPNISWVFALSPGSDQCLESRWRSFRQFACFA